MSTPRVVAVLVTWNRRELLEESLAAVRSQTHAPIAVVVVDNASTDGTGPWLDSAFAGLFAPQTFRAFVLGDERVYPVGMKALTPN